MAFGYGGCRICPSLGTPSRFFPLAADSARATSPAACLLFSRCCLGGAAGGCLTTVCLLWLFVGPGRTLEGAFSPRAKD